MIGWGHTKYEGKASPFLQEADLRMMSNRQCEAKYEEAVKKYSVRGNVGITERMLCAQMEGKDSCQGDSGGPLLRKVSLIPSRVFFRKLLNNVRWERAIQYG